MQTQTEIETDLDGFRLADLGVFNEAEAKRILSDPHLYNRLIYDLAIFRLAQAHASACELVLKNPLLAERMNGARLYELALLYPSVLPFIQMFPVLLHRYEAYAQLRSVDLDDRTSEEIKSDLLVAGLFDQDGAEPLVELSRLNMRYADLILDLIIQKNYVINAFRLSEIGVSHPSLGLKIVTEPLLWSQFKHFPSALNALAVSDVVVRQRILQTPSLLNMLPQREQQNLQEMDNNIAMSVKLAGETGNYLPPKSEVDEKAKGYINIPAGPQFVTLSWLEQIFTWFEALFSKIDSILHKQTDVQEQTNDIFSVPPQKQVGVVSSSFCSSLWQQPTTVFESSAITPCCNRKEACGA
jgi:hypothetical protein